MESDLWRGFVAVAEHGSFTAAANELPISQSGLSQQIRRLESLLGTALFERTSRQVNLTEAGMRLLPLIEVLVEAEDAVFAAARSEETVEEPETIELLIAEDGTGDLVVHLIDGLRQRVANVRIEVTQVSVGNQLAALSSAGPCAALVERTPSPQPVGEGRRTIIRPEPMAIVVGDDERDDTGAPATMTVAEAGDYDLRPMDWLPEHWLTWFPLLKGSTGDRRDSVLVVSSFRNAVQAVALDNRATIAPLSIATATAGIGCSVVPLTDAPAASLDLVTLADGSLLDHLHDVAAAMATTSPQAATDRTRSR